MNFSKQQFFIKDGKEMDMVNYLSRLVFDPIKIRNANRWHLSPLRYKKTASFKIYRKINGWYYHGLCNRGKKIGFGILYHSYTVAYFLQKIDADFSFHWQVVYPSDKPDHLYKITILDDLFISSFALLTYFKQRKIPFDIAGEYCREIRNPYFKAGSSSKDVTTSFVINVPKFLPVEGRLSCALTKEEEIIARQKTSF